MISTWIMAMIRSYVAFLVILCSISMSLATTTPTITSAAALATQIAISDRFYGSRYICDESSSCTYSALQTSCFCVPNSSSLVSSRIRNVL
jgi:hypothetical protein